MLTLNRENEYVLPGDYDVIATWAEKSHACISFRSAGKDTLKCLERGAGAKPHSILDKTIKRKAGSEAVDAFFKDFEHKGTAENLIMGLVGHWENGNVDGIYLTTLGKDAFSGEDVLTQNNMSYLRLNDKKKKDNLIKYFKSLYDTTERADMVCRELDEHPDKQTDKPADVQFYLFTRLFFSGDYDAHDLMHHNEVAGTETDSVVLAGLKKALSDGRKAQLKELFNPLDEKYFEEEEKEDYYRVQHGPQYNYIAQMANENLKTVLDKIKEKEAGKDKVFDVEDLKGLNVLVRTVMDESLPAAMCDGTGGTANWILVKNIDQLAGFYESKGTTIKGIWRDSAEMDAHIIKLFHHVMLLLSDVRRQRGDFTIGKTRLTMDEVLSYYKKMYGYERYNGFVEEAIKRTFG